MSPPKMNGSTPARTEYPSADKSEISDLKYNYMKMIETHKL